MLIRWLSSASLALAAIACSANSSSPPASQPPKTESLLGPDGKHFATERVYQGNCAPPGSRGGCHTITLRPDGTFRTMLYDAAIDGTYTVSGTTVTMQLPDLEPEEMTLSPDGTKLGELALVR